MKPSLHDWLKRLESLHPKAIDLGLDRCARVYRRLGAPRPAKSIWTVAGTNGKGSVTSYIASMLAVAGRSAGCYTSPHILRFNERIRINGAEADDAAIVDAFRRVDEARGNVSLTYFEFTTLAALLMFGERALDAVVLEVGLGGRLDAVNLVDSDCAVITAIGLDHQEYLGHDRERIGFEKAGIMRSGKPVVIADPAPPASVLEHAAQTGARPLCLGTDFALRRSGDTCRYTGPAAADWRLPLPSLPGRHQLDNLAAAITAFGTLAPAADFTPDLIGQGIRAARLPGRLQAWPADDRLVLDVGHNPLAARVVAEYLGQQGGEPGACVLGMLSDKDVEGVVEALSPRVSEWYCAGLPGSRGLSGAALAQRVRGKAGDAAVREFDTVAPALLAAMAAPAPSHRILVFGSFLTVAEAVGELERHGPIKG